MAFEINIEHIGNGDRLSKSVKLADVIDNASDIVDYDSEFAVICLREKKMLPEVLKGGNPVLFKRAEELVGNLLEKLAQL